MDDRSRDFVSPSLVVGGLVGAPISGFALGPGAGVAVLLVSSLLAALVRFGPRLLAYLEVTKRDGLMHGLATNALKQGSKLDISSCDLQIHVAASDAGAAPDQEIIHDQ